VKNFRETIDKQLDRCYSNLVWRVEYLSQSPGNSIV
jgi:hypothetical protein